MLGKSLKELYFMVCSGNWRFNKKIIWNGHSNEVNFRCCISKIHLYFKLDDLLSITDNSYFVWAIYVT